MGALNKYIQTRHPLIQAEAKAKDVNGYLFFMTRASGAAGILLYMDAVLTKLAEEGRPAIQVVELETMLQEAYWATLTAGKPS